ncbi:putative YTH domain-containing protein [Helianthus debilis subsp. tardiflorus]
MDGYNVPEHGNPDAYLIQGTTNLNSQVTIPLIEPLEAMYNEGAPEFVVDQGMYYPSASGYGYICTGLESPGDWDDQHRVFGVDGQNVQFIGGQTESYPYVYYTPSYGYAQSPYNPYNPYIPGAIIGADGSFVAAQQYYVPTYENGSSSPAYFPMVVQPGTETYTTGTTDQFMDMAASTANRIDSSGVNSNSLSETTTYTMNPGRGSSNHTNAPGKVSESFKSNDGPNKITATSGGLTPITGSVPASSQALQGRGAQAIDNLPNGKIGANNNHLKSTVSSGNGLSNLASSDNGRVTVDKVRSKVPFGKTSNDVNGNPNSLGEQNRGPRTSTSSTQLTVKAYSTRAGNIDAQGNITIHIDQYNKDDFPAEYVNAKFFVIKSYSEDDVHKSIKYNVWSSTPNGNKKLNNAYEEAQKLAAGDPKGCPIFLFFSVNASGQFCGVAEMIGRVDFHKDMDFWQQDKWSGSFPVKWHFVKDVPNPHFRHIILENNEHKPVTNSRDTQEIKYKKGIEMLKVFKNYAKKTSLLDDFMYYENRQKILQEEKARLLVKSFGTPVFVPVLHPPRKLTNFYSSASDEKSGKENDINTSDSNSVANNDNRQLADEKSNDNISRFKSLSISSEQVETKPVESGGGASVSAVSAEPVNIVTVGSMPVKVNGFGESSGFLTVGTIPLDPKALQVKEGGVSTKMGSKKG